MHLHYGRCRDSAAPERKPVVCTCLTISSSVRFNFGFYAHTRGKPIFFRSFLLVLLIYIFSNRQTDGQTTGQPGTQSRAKRKHQPPRTADTTHGVLLGRHHTARQTHKVTNAPHTCSIYDVSGRRLTTWQPCGNPDFLVRPCAQVLPPAVHPAFSREYGRSPAAQTAAPQRRLGAPASEPPPRRERPRLATSRCLRAGAAASVLPHNLLSAAQPSCYTLTTCGCACVARVCAAATASSAPAVTAR